MSLLKVDDIQTSGGVPNRGHIIQVVSTTYTENFSASISGMSWTEVPGLTTGITPSSSNSKILISVTIGGIESSGLNQRMGMALRKNSTNIAVNTTSGNQTVATWAGSGTNSNDIRNQAFFTHLDSPATTSTVTYRVMITTEGSYTMFINRSNSNANSSSVFKTASSMTLYEVSA